MKKTFSVLLCAAIVITMTVSTFAGYDANYEVRVNGKTVAFEKAEPQLLGDQAFLPLVTVFKQLGLDNISWNGTARTVTAQGGGVKVVLTIGDKAVSITKDGTTKTVIADEAPYIDNGSTYISADLIADALDYIVEWDVNGLNVLKINTAPDYFVSKEGGMSYLSYDMDPVLTVPSGSVVRFETDDAWRGLLTGRETPYAAVKDQYPHTTADYNPVSGPVYIEEAKAGDIIRIEIQKIELADEGHMYQGADFLKLYHLAPEDICQSFYIKDGKAYMDDTGLVLELAPMVGCISVAPTVERSPAYSLDPDTFGGNMDCTRIKEGTVLYLKANVDGALINTGDLHACMGDGEASGMGIEIPGFVTLKLDVIKGVELPIQYPMAVEGGKLIIMGHAPTMDEAIMNAINDTHAFLTQVAGFSKNDAANLIAIASNVRVNQIVDTLMGARVEFSLELLEQNGYKFDL